MPMIQVEIDATNAENTRLKIFAFVEYKQIATHRLTPRYAYELTPVIQALISINTRNNWNILYSFCRFILLFSSPARINFSGVGIIERKTLKSYTFKRFTTNLVTVLQYYCSGPQNLSNLKHLMLEIDWTIRAFDRRLLFERERLIREARQVKSKLHKERRPLEPLRRQL